MFISAITITNKFRIFGSIHVTIGSIGINMIQEPEPSPPKEKSGLSTSLESVAFIRKNNNTLNNQALKNLRIDNLSNTENKVSANTISGIEVKSPIIGTAYHAPEPGAKKFVENGKKIKKGDTVMIVEAMKTMNHVPSPKDGVVKSVNVEDGQPVEYGQTLVVID